jgi:hypothetical protein
VSGHSVGVLIVVVGFTFIIAAARADQQSLRGWGYDHPEFGRREFDTEAACWSTLSHQKDVDPELYGVPCTHRKLGFLED